MRVILFRSPTAACNVASSSMATPRAACLPSSVVMCSPSLPDQGLPSFFASVQINKRRCQCAQTERKRQRNHPPRGVGRQAT
jgi:hypothetical protein